MLTPPPSPLSLSEKSGAGESLSPEPPTQLHKTKRCVSTRAKWSVLLVPCVLMIITLSTRYIDHPAFFDSLSGLPDCHTFDPEWSDQGLHKRHPQPWADPPPSSSITFPSSSTVSSTSTTDSSTPTSQPIPTIPSNPALPIPFPQPFDTTLSSNFSTNACVDFYTNMTQSAAFRECRPFGLLIESSSAFLNAQGNISLLNDMVWGTCNTELEFSQCTANMNQFADSLRTECATELSNNNVFVADTLTGLLVYSLMRNVGCQSNPSTNVYCYVSAAVNPNPSDIYFYQLPFGILLPNNTTPTCSACTKSIMGLYLSAVLGTDPDTTDATVRSSLAKTYEPASQLSNNVCGSSYVEVTSATGINGGMRLVGHGLWLPIVVVVMIGFAF